MLSALFHERLAAGDTDSSLHALELALQTPAYRDEALVWKGLLALREGRMSAAFLPLAIASERFAKRAELKALLGRCLGSIAPAELVISFLRAALVAFPADPALRQQYWRTRQALCAADELAAELAAQLAYIDNPSELKLALQLLKRGGGAPLTFGVVDYDPVRGALVGWAVDLQNPDRPPMLRLEAGSVTAEIPADQPSALLTQAGLPAGHGGILVRLPRPVDSLRVSFCQGAELIGSPVAAVARFEPPVPGDKRPAKQPVDILLPIYKGTEATLACLNSLLGSSQHNRTPHRIIVLDDFSPEPALVRAVEALARKRKLIHIRRPANLGFIRNMNRGMALNPASDVLWLNADTLVQGNWLDRLRAAAYQAPDIASVTPWSNNGELMSFPQSRVCHPMPSARMHARLDNLARKSELAPVEIEVGCGFCLYIRRDALNDVGYLDEVELRRGYGEESDWCLRARGKGWRHLGATNVFVAHAGGQSFGAEKALRVFQNNAVLRRRYPDAEGRFDAFVARDPLRPARDVLQRLEDPELAQSSLRKARADESVDRSASQSSQPRLAAGAQLPGQCWLIADRLDNQAIGEQWLGLARQLARQRQPISLLLVEDSPWEVQLLATGRVNRLPAVEGLTATQIIQLCDTRLAVSLDETPRILANGACSSTQLAIEHQLPLYAPASSGLSVLGALSVEWLRPYLTEPACA
ncbi:glycosyltransferase family 2 protein [Stutzerimonas stutzeri]|uniref:glycosyltransferase family 2 protein n=1 Tax=Stutzerimonas stutzeri TaxID=316 RepID=UPI002108F0DC|nr:glycosyltransferase family 2 protein [Stutzerimonas stutzeri]MCQ4321753.1 glycosyltransferase family 2 protein [Stutzerimonas stutzeri]